MNFCVCVSGNLGLIVLRHLCEKGVSVACVLTDRGSDGIVDYAKSNSLPLFAGNPRKGKAAQWIAENNVSFDHLLSINYLFILETDVLSLVRGFAVNFHGSLLPRYRGRTPHVWAIINGEKECGVTAHLMNAKCDDGDIVRQVVVPIGDDDTGAKILEKYNQLYPGLVQNVVDDIENDRVECHKQDSNKATYFSKRTPDDGQIDWNWQRQRIRNWVRAQALPYPGAFSFVNGRKIIINRITFSDFGFIDTMQNGLVIGTEGGNPVVKTPNGAVELAEYWNADNKEKLQLSIGELLK